VRPRIAFPIFHTNNRGLRHFVVENAKSARAFLGALGMPVRDLVIEELGDNRLGVTTSGCSPRRAARRSPIPVRS
jgi:hypothetical protein